MALKLAKYLLISCISATALASQAPKPVSTAGSKATAPKIAIFDLRRVLPMDNSADLSKASHEWRDFINELKEKFVPLEKEMETLAENLKKVKAEFESLQQSRIASKEALENKAEIGMALDQQLRMKAMEREQLVTKEFGDKQNVLMPKITAIVEKIAADQAWDGIAHKEVFIVSAKLTDITDQVLGILNKNYAADLKKQEQKAQEQKTEKEKSTPPVKA